MKQIYFLCGGGCNRYEAMDFVEAFPQEVTILELPGNGLEKDQVISQLDDLTNWFAQKIEDQTDCAIIAHSMGANLAPYLALQFPAIKQLVLLDGGYYDFDQILSLEEELAQTKDYFEQMVFDQMDSFLEMIKENSSYWSTHQEQAAKESLTLVDGRYHLNIHKETFLHLLRLQRDCQQLLAELKIPTLLIPQTLDCPTWKSEMLKAVPAHIKKIEHLSYGHSPHTEKPGLTAQVVADFLERPI